MRDFEMANTTTHRSSVRIRNAAKKVSKLQKIPIVKKKSPPPPRSKLADKGANQEQKANFNYYMDNVLELMDQCQKRKQSRKPFKGFSSEEKLRMTQLKQFYAGRIKMLTRGAEGVDKFYDSEKAKVSSLTSNVGQSNASGRNQNHSTSINFVFDQETFQDKVPQTYAPQEGGSRLLESLTHSHQSNPQQLVVPSSLEFVYLAEEVEILEEEQTCPEEFLMYGPGWRIKQLIQAKRQYSVDEIVALHVNKLKLQRSLYGKGKEFSRM